MAYPQLPAEDLQLFNSGGPIPFQDDWLHEIPLDCGFGLLNSSDYPNPENQNIDLALHAIDNSGQFATAPPSFQTEVDYSTSWPFDQMTPSFYTGQTQVLEDQAYRHDSHVQARNALNHDETSSSLFDPSIGFQDFQDKPLSMSGQFGQIDKSIDLVQKPLPTTITETVLDRNGSGWLGATSKVHPEYPLGILANTRKRNFCSDIQRGSDLQALNGHHEMEEAVVESSMRTKAIDLISKWLEKNPTILPRPEHVNALAVLCSLPLPYVETLLNQILRGQSFGNPGLKLEENTVKRRKTKSLEPLLEHPGDEFPGQKVLEEVAIWVKERAQKCLPASDPNALVRDETKIYQCTSECGKSFGTKDDWRKHEERNFPQEGWICDLGVTAAVNGILTCVYCHTQDPDIGHAFQSHGKRAERNCCKNKPWRARGRVFLRKGHFVTHFENMHPSVPSAKYVARNRFTVDSSFPRRCGFCHEYRFRNWRDRIDHISRHFEGGEEMSSWNSPDLKDLKIDEAQNGDANCLDKNNEIQDEESNEQFTRVRHGMTTPDRVAPNSECIKDNSPIGVYDLSDLWYGTAISNTVVSIPRAIHGNNPVFISAMNNCSQESSSVTMRSTPSIQESTHRIPPASSVANMPLLTIPVHPSLSFATQSFLVDSESIGKEIHALRDWDNEPMGRSLLNSDCYLQIGKEAQLQVLPNSTSRKMALGSISSLAGLQDNITTTCIYNAPRSPTRKAFYAKLHDVSLKAMDGMTVVEYFEPDNGAGDGNEDIIHSQCRWDNRVTQDDELDENDDEEGKRITRTPNGTRKRRDIMDYQSPKLASNVEKGCGVPSPDVAVNDVDVTAPAAAAEIRTEVDCGVVENQEESSAKSPDPRIDNEGLVESPASYDRNNSCGTPTSYYSSLGSPTGEYIAGKIATPLAAAHSSFQPRLGEAIIVPLQDSLPREDRDSAVYSVVRASGINTDIFRPSDGELAESLAQSDRDSEITKVSRFISAIPESSAGGNLKQRRVVRRKAPLSIEMKKSAAAMRSIRACWHCLINHLKCSEGNICRPCSKRHARLAIHGRCIRGGFASYSELFFPGVLSPSHIERNITDLVGEKSSEFTNTVVEMTCGSSDHTMRLEVVSFKPKTYELFNRHHLNEDVEQKRGDIHQHSAQLNVVGTYLRDLEEKCIVYINSMVSNANYAVETFKYESNLRRGVLEAVYKYGQVALHSLPHKALMLHAMHYFMMHRISFNSAHKRELGNICQDIGSGPGTLSASELRLSRQIKHAMQRLLRQITKEVLDGLGFTLRSRCKSSWAVSFSVILILCFRIEEVQITISGFVQCRPMLVDEDLGEARSSGLKVLLDLEDMFYELSTIFHRWYRPKTFNPLRDNLSLEADLKWSEPDERLITDMRYVVAEYEPEIVRGATKPRLDESAVDVNHKEFKEENQGRLIAKFLEPFI